MTLNTKHKYNTNELNPSMPGGNNRDLIECKLGS